MSTLKQCRIWPLKALCRPPWPSSPAIAPHLSTSQLIEEEKTPYYRPDRFYPARLGEILGGRYQLATKLGYGSSSTVWLARDLHRLFPLGFLRLHVLLLSSVLTPTSQVAVVERAICRRQNQCEQSRTATTRQTCC